MAHGVFLGRLEVQRRDLTALTEDEATVLEIFAELSAIVLHSSHLRCVLQHLAWTDELTGLANRRRILAELRDRAAAGVVSLLFIDFDGLKDVNDALGYEAGDELVRAVGRGLAGSARAGELIGRLGGDELVAVLATGDAEHARRRASAFEAILTALPVEPTIRAHYLGASVGSATLEPGETADALLTRASDEMRARKDARKSRRLAVVAAQPRVTAGHSAAITTTDVTCSRSGPSVSSSLRASSPEAPSSSVMSAPPISSPFTNTCGIVGQPESPDELLTDPRIGKDVDRRDRGAGFPERPKRAVGVPAHHGLRCPFHEHRDIGAVDDVLDLIAHRHVVPLVVIRSSWIVPSASGAASAAFTSRCWSIRLTPSKRALSIVTWKWSPPPVLSTTAISAPGNAWSRRSLIASVATA